jgi:hypothetical protein
MIILNNSAPPADLCAFTADVNEPFITNGTLLLTARVPYVLTPLIQSKIDAAMGEELQRTLEFRGARIDLAVGTADNPIKVEGGGTTQTFTFTDTELAQLHDDGVTHFKSLFSGSLPPNGGFANVAFNIVPVQLLDAISQKVAGTTGNVDAEVVASIVPYGDIGGDNIDGDIFVYPVDVCTGCIANQVINNAGTGPEPCPLASGTIIRTGNPCNIFQDGIVDCCTANVGMANESLVCPATISMGM